MKFIKKHIKLIITTAAIVAVVIVVSSIIGGINHQNANSITCNIEKDQTYGAVKIKTTMAELQKKNIEFGDSVKVVFTSGYNVEEVPVYNGDYSNSGSHLIKAINDDYVIFQIQNETNIWEVANLNPEDTVRITLDIKSKYAFVHDAFNRKKFPTVDEYDNKEDFVNFRPLTGGNIKENTIYRSSCPYTSNLERAKVINQIYQDYGFDSFIDLTQTDSQYKNELADNNYNTNYFFSKFKETNGRSVDTEGMNSINIKLKDSNSKILSAILKYAKKGGRVCIFSYNDDDTTGYFCAILNAIAGASYDEIIDQYMQSYNSYYDFDKIDTPALYSAAKDCHIDWFLHRLTKTPWGSDMHNCDFAYCAEMYLRSNGVSTKDINLIKSAICKNSN